MCWNLWWIKWDLWNLDPFFSMNRWIEITVRILNQEDLWIVMDREKMMGTCWWFIFLWGDGKMMVVDGDGDGWGKGFFCGHWWLTYGRYGEDSWVSWGSLSKSCYGGRFGNSEHFVAGYEGLALVQMMAPIARLQQHGEISAPWEVGKMPGKWALKRVPTKV